MRNEISYLNFSIFYYRICYKLKLIIFLLDPILRSNMVGNFNIKIITFCIITMSAKSEKKNFK